MFKVTLIVTVVEMAPAGGHKSIFTKMSRDTQYPFPPYPGLGVELRNDLKRKLQKDNLTVQYVTWLSGRERFQVTFKSIEVSCTEKGTIDMMKFAGWETGK